jgi:shikimate dehydrogenase
VVILGTGGAARAAAVGLLENEVEELILLGRTEEHIDGLLDYLRTLATMAHGMTHVNGAPLQSPEINRLLSSADLVVNATPVGLMADDAALLFTINVLAAKTLVMDMIFNPPLTPLLRAALAHGCRVLNGLSMLLYQGALAFELWVGRPAPLEVMRRALGLVKEG